jgi:hypothetical protein
LIISKGIIGLGVEWFPLGLLLSEKLAFELFGVELSLNINYGG